MTLRQSAQYSSSFDFVRSNHSHIIFNTELHHLRILLTTCFGFSKSSVYHNDKIDCTFGCLGGNLVSLKYLHRIGAKVVTGTDRRQSPRRRLLRRAQVVFRNGYSVLDCIVLDLSEGGARLKLTNWNVLPNRFELRMENSPPQIASVCHRGPDMTGIQFLFDEGE